MNRTRLCVSPPFDAEVALRPFSPTPASVESSRPSSCFGAESGSCGASDAVRAGLGRHATESLIAVKSRSFPQAPGSATAPGDDHADDGSDGGGDENGLDGLLANAVLEAAFPL